MFEFLQRKTTKHTKIIYGKVELLTLDQKIDVSPEGGGGSEESKEVHKGGNNVEMNCPLHSSPFPNGAM
jgi:hypothetical protein